jgi:hypothetical protein
LPKLSFVAALSAIVLVATAAVDARAWDDQGHRIVALVAEHYLDPAAKQKVEAMLAADPDNPTKHDIAGAAIWLDARLAALGPKDPDDAARIGSWRFVLIERDHPDIDAACHGHPKLPAGIRASAGPAACAPDKINQFAAELGTETAPASERLLALKYLLAIVADLHEPVYASDDHNDSGQNTRVSGGGSDPGSLRHYWDAEFIDYLGDDPKATADDLADGVRQSKTFDKMAAGTPKDWALESFGLARDHAYGKLPAKKADGSYDLPPDYVTDAIETVRLQMARAGIRLASVLNRALGTAH